MSNLSTNKNFLMKRIKVRQPRVMRQQKLLRQQTTDEVRIQRKEDEQRRQKVTKVFDEHARTQEIGKVTGVKVKKERELSMNAIERVNTTVDRWAQAQREYDTAVDVAIEREIFGGSPARRAIKKRTYMSMLDQDASSMYSSSPKRRRFNLEFNLFMSKQPSPLKFLGDSTRSPQKLTLRNKPSDMSPQTRLPVMAFRKQDSLNL